VVPLRIYVGKEMPVTVVNDVGGLNISLSIAAPAGSAVSDAAQGAQPAPQ